MADIYTNEDKDLFCAWFISNHAINYTLSFWLGVFSYRQKVDHALHSANCQSQSAFARNVEVFIDVFQLYVVVFLQGDLVQSQYKKVTQVGNLRGVQK